MAKEFKNGLALGLVLSYFVVNFISGVTGSFTPWLVVGVAAWLFLSK
jgi:hypothetical protein